MAGNNGTSTAIASFFAQLGFQVDSSNLQTFVGHLQSAAKTAMAAGAAIAGAATGIGLFVAKTAYTADALGDFAEQEGVNVQALGELGYAAQIMGSNLDAVKSTVQGLNKTIGESVAGFGRGALAMQRYGFSVKNADGSMKSVDTLLAEVAEKMKTMSRSEAIAMAEKLGIDRTLIPLLTSGAERIDRLRKRARELGVTTEDIADKAGTLTDTLDDVKQLFFGMKIAVASELMPVLNELGQKFIDWVLLNKEAIKSTIVKALMMIGEAFKFVLDVIIPVASALASFISWVSQSTTALVILGAALAIFSVIKVIRGIIGVVAATKLFIATTLAARIATLKTQAAMVAGWLRVSASVLAARIAVLKTQAVMIAGWLRVAASTLLAFWPVTLIAGLLIGIGVVVWRNWDKLIKGLKFAWQGFKEMLAAFFDWVSTPFVWLGEKIGWLIDKALSLGKAVAKFFGLMDDAEKTEIVARIKKEQEERKASGVTTDTLKPFAGDPLGHFAASHGAMGKAEAASIVNNHGGSVTKQSTVNNTNNTTVRAEIKITSTDPAAAGRATAREIERMNRDATRNLQTAVAL